MHQSARTAVNQLGLIAGQKLNFYFLRCSFLSTYSSVISLHLNGVKWGLGHAPPHLHSFSAIGICYMLLMRDISVENKQYNSVRSNEKFMLWMERLNSQQVHAVITSCSNGEGIFAQSAEVTLAVQRIWFTLSVLSRGWNRRVGGGNTNVPPKTKEANRITVFQANRRPRSSQMYSQPPSLLGGYVIGLTAKIRPR